jgi:hypothetical protein
LTSAALGSTIGRASLNGSMGREVIRGSRFLPARFSLATLAFPWAARGTRAHANGELKRRRSRPQRRFEMKRLRPHCELGFHCWERYVHVVRNQEWVVRACCYCGKCQVCWRPPWTFDGPRIGRAGRRSGAPLLIVR